jgi:hypothetical protein
MTQFSTAAASRNEGISNGREVGAYAIAQAIKIGLTYAASFSGLLSPLYAAAFKSGGAIAVLPVAFVINVVWGGVALLLFLGLRAALGGVPAMIAGPGREGAFMSRGGEIGAFVIAYLLVIVALMIASSVFLSAFYGSLNRSGQMQIVYAIGLSISLANAAVVYLIFITLRSAFCRGPTT